MPVVCIDEKVRAMRKDQLGLGLGLGLGLESGGARD